MDKKFFENSESQASQESFVLNVLKEKTNGFYVEVGAFSGKKISNTYLLETEYNWNGFGIEILDFRAKYYNQIRKNKCVLADGRTFDYLNYFIENNYPKQIDYLQVDIEPAENSLIALKNIINTGYRFSVITFEHDLHMNPEKNKKIKEESHELLKSQGYFLVIENVKLHKNPFEDWWVDPTAIPYDNYKDFISKDVTFFEIFDLTKPEWWDD